MLAMLEQVIQRTQGRRLSLLEVASGTSDGPRAAAERARKRGIFLRNTCLDRNFAHVEKGATAVVGDALDLPFANESFDLVSCGLFAHHLESAEIVRLAQEALRVARVALLINDLERNLLHWAMAGIGRPLWRSRLTRHDSVVSVRRSYTPEELRSLLQQAEPARGHRLVVIIFSATGQSRGKGAGSRRRFGGRRCYVSYRAAVIDNKQRNTTEGAPPTKAHDQAYCPERMSQPISGVAHSRSTPPGPSGSLLRGNFPDLQRDVLSFLTRCAREYGDLVRYRLITFYGYLLSHPDYIEDVLVRNSANFIKGRGLRANKILLGNGLLTSEGELWRQQRRLAQPAFHRERIAAYVRTILDYAQNTVAGWSDGEERDIGQEMMRLTLQIAAEIFFGVDVADEIPHVKAAFEEVSRQNARRTRLFHLPDAIPTPANVRYNRAVRQLDSIIYRIIEQRRGNRQDAGDLLFTLLQARDENGEAMSRRQLRDEVITFFLAGHETTALALSWTWYLLAQHPEAESELVAELEHVLAGREPAIDDVPALRYTEAVITEAMRLYPPAWLMVRQAVHDYTIAGYRIPAGSSVVFSQWVMHRDPRYFLEPDRFYPDRWLHGLAKELPRFAYFPFGGGPRLCIGAGFAMTETVLLLAVIARQFHFQLIAGHPVVPMPAITLRPQYGIKVRITRRRPLESAVRASLNYE